METRVTKLLGIEYPIIQGGMAWVANANLAANVSKAGGIGFIGAANAPGEWVRSEIRKAREITDKPVGVNIMLLSEHIDEVEQIKSSGEAVLKGVKGKIYREDGSVLEVVAGGGKVKNEAKDFELNDKVVAVLSSGGKLTAESIRWQQTEDVITASGNVRLLKDDTLATGDKAVTSSAFERLKLEGHAEVQRGGDYNE